MLASIVGSGLEASTAAASSPIVPVTNAVSSITNAVKETVFKVTTDTGSVVQSVNYTLQETPEARAASNATSSGTYGNPLESVSLKGLPSLPGVGEGLPTEDGANADLDNEPPGGTDCPAPGNGHEYMVVWAGKMNAADLTGTDITDALPPFVQ